MEKADFLSAITSFPAISLSLSSALLQGSYRSIFRGSGIEFDEVREYRTGDDLRAIDRNVSARFARPFVKLYREEREFSCLAVLDVSPSMLDSGAGALSRFDAALLGALLLGFALDAQGEKFGSVIFSLTETQIFRPERGKSKILSMLDGALSMSKEGHEAGAAPPKLRAGKNADRPQAAEPQAAEPHDGLSPLSRALIQASRLGGKQSLVVVFSDFLSPPLWERELTRLAEHSACICIRIEDPIEKQFRGRGFIPILDVESGTEIRVNTSSPGFGAKWKQFWERHDYAFKTACARGGAGAFTLSTESLSGLPAELIKIFSRHRSLK
jgi:uncharacterized protein (DUF58 family)